MTRLRQFLGVSLALTISVATFTSPTPVAAATAVVVANPPCTPSGAYYNVSKTVFAEEQARLQKCVSGGYTYVWPQCRIEGGTSDNIGWGGAARITFTECYVFVWTTSGSFVRLWGFTNYSVPTTPDYTFSAWHRPTGGALKLSGYKVSSEVCGKSRFWFDFDGYYEKNIGCAQSPYGWP